MFGGGGGGNSIFDMFFGGQGQGARRRGKSERRGGDLQIRLPLTLEEIASGVEKTLQLKRYESCPDCTGSGVKSGADIKECPACKGSGEVRQVSRSVFGQFINVGTCPQCGGEGKIISKPCQGCGGEGRVKKDATIKVKIPAGAADGNYLPLRGQGNIGLRGGPAGDILVYIEEKAHPLFTRHGDDLLVGISVSYAQAVLGCKIEVPMLSGKAELSIPSGTPSGKVFRMRGKGLPRLNSGGSGDELIRVEVWMPQKLSSEEKKLLKQLEELQKNKVPGACKINPGD